MVLCTDARRRCTGIVYHWDDGDGEIVASRAEENTADDTENGNTDTNWQGDVSCTKFGWQLRHTARLRGDRRCRRRPGTTNTNRTISTWLWLHAWGVRSCTNVGQKWTTARHTVHQQPKHWSVKLRNIAAHVWVQNGDDESVKREGARERGERWIRILISKELKVN